MNGGWVFIVFGLAMLVLARRMGTATFEYMNRRRRPPYGPFALRTIIWSDRLAGVLSVVLGVVIWLDPNFLRTS
jgi:hypothetical protein